MPNRSSSRLPAVFAEAEPIFFSADPHRIPAGKLMVYDVTFLHFHRYIEIGVCVEGTGICYVEEQEYSFSAGDVQIIFPYQRHLSKNDTAKPSLWYWESLDPVRILEKAGFSGVDKVEGWLLNEMALCGILDRQRYPELCALIKEIAEQVVHPDLNALHRKEELAVSVLRLILRLCEASRDLPKLQLENGTFIMGLVPALECIHHSLDAGCIPNVEELSRLCGMSASHFRRVFHKAMGMSPKAHITACCMHKAKKLLACTSLSMTQIASQVGYQDISGFNRCFLEAAGMSPSAFRRHIAGG